MNNFRNVVRLTGEPSHNSHPVGGLEPAKATTVPTGSALSSSELTRCASSLLSVSTAIMRAMGDPRHLRHFTVGTVLGVRAVERADLRPRQWAPRQLVPLSRDAQARKLRPMLLGCLVLPDCRDALPMSP